MEINYTSSHKINWRERDRSSWERKIKCARSCSRYENCIINTVFAFTEQHHNFKTWVSKKQRLETWSGLLYLHSSPAGKRSPLHPRWGSESRWSKPSAHLQPAAPHHAPQSSIAGWNTVKRAHTHTFQKQLAGIESTKDKQYIQTPNTELYWAQGYYRKEILRAHTQIQLNKVFHVTQ